MPLYSDYYYGGQPPPYYFSSSPYSSVTSRISSPYSFSYMSPVSTMLSASIGTNPLPRGLRSYSPLLTSISESGSPLLPRRDISSHRSSPRPLKSYYRQPRPVVIDTESIDLSKKKKDDNDEESVPGKISRGRTIVRMQTRKPRENPELKRKKTQAEILMEKYLIKEKPVKEKKEEIPKRKRIWEEREEITSTPAQSGNIKRSNTIVKIATPLPPPETKLEEIIDEVVPVPVRKVSIDSELLKEEAALFDFMIQEELGSKNKKEVAIDSQHSENSVVDSVDTSKHKTKRDQIPYVRKKSSSTLPLDESGTVTGKKKSHLRKRSSKNLPLDEINLSATPTDDDSVQDDSCNKINKRKSTKKKKLKFKIDSLHVEEKSSPKLLRKLRYEVIVEEGNSNDRNSVKRPPENAEETINNLVEADIPEVVEQEGFLGVCKEDKEAVFTVNIGNRRLKRNTCDNKCDSNTDNIMTQECGVDTKDRSLTNKVVQFDENLSVTIDSTADSEVNMSSKKDKNKIQAKVLSETHLNTDNNVEDTLLLGKMKPQETDSFKSNNTERGIVDKKCQENKALEIKSKKKPAIKSDHSIGAILKEKSLCSKETEEMYNNNDVFISSEAKVLSTPSQDKDVLVSPDYNSNANDSEVSAKDINTSDDLNLLIEKKMLDERPPEKQITGTRVFDRKLKDSAAHEPVKPESGNPELNRNLISNITNKSNANTPSGTPELSRKLITSTSNKSSPKTPVGTPELSRKILNDSASKSGLKAHKKQPTEVPINKNVVEETNFKPEKGSNHSDKSAESNVLRVEGKIVESSNESNKNESNKIYSVEDVNPLINQDRNINFAEISPDGSKARAKQVCKETQAILEQSNIKIDAKNSPDLFHSEQNLLEIDKESTTSNADNIAAGDRSQQELQKNMKGNSEFIENKAIQSVSEESKTQVTKTKDQGKQTNAGQKIKDKLLPGRIGENKNHTDKELAVNRTLKDDAVSHKYSKNTVLKTEIGKHKRIADNISYGEKSSEIDDATEKCIKDEPCLYKVEDINTLIQEGKPVIKEGNGVHDTTPEQLIKHKHLPTKSENRILSGKNLLLSKAVENDQTIEEVSKDLPAPKTGKNKNILSKIANFQKPSTTTDKHPEGLVPIKLMPKKLVEDGKSSLDRSAKKESKTSTEKDDSLHKNPVVKDVENVVQDSTVIKNKHALSDTVNDTPVADTSKEADNTSVMPSSKNHTVRKIEDKTDSSIKETKNDQSSIQFTKQKLERSNEIEENKQMLIVKPNKQDTNTINHISDKLVKNNPTLIKSQDSKPSPVNKEQDVLIETSKNKGSTDTKQKDPKLKSDLLKQVKPLSPVSQEAVSRTRDVTNKEKEVEQSSKQDKQDEKHIVKSILDNREEHKTQLNHSEESGDKEMPTDFVNQSKKKRIKSESDILDEFENNSADLGLTLANEKSKSLSDVKEKSSKKKKKSKDKDASRKKEETKSPKKDKTKSPKNEKSKSPKKIKTTTKSADNLKNKDHTEVPAYLQNEITSKTEGCNDSKEVTAEKPSGEKESNVATAVMVTSENTSSEPPKTGTRLVHFINKCMKLTEDDERVYVEMSDEDEESEETTSSDYTSDSEYTSDSDDSSEDGSTESRDHGSPTRHQSNTALRLDNEKTESAQHHPGRITPPATTIPKFRKYTMDDFQFLKVLGKGSFGKVLLAELRGTQYYYAVKCLKKDVVLEDDDVECTLIERKVLALGTNHPYLCHLFCTFQTDSHLFFVMEYLNGGDLMFHIQQQGRFDEGRARFYAAEIVSGLKFLHKKGIVYRDLKLDNILLDFDGHVRIADFGMCKLQIYLDRTADTFCGTPDYMAPEIIKGLKYNQCVDWWSFGILLYEMLVGQSPFSGCDEDDLFWCICNRQPHYPRFITLEAKRILIQLLEKEAQKRLGSCENGAAEVMAHPFFNNLDWDRLERRELMPPFKPNVKHPLDVHYFDKHFTAERACLTPIDPSILQSMDQAQFQGFSYTNPNVTD